MENSFFKANPEDFKVDENMKDVSTQESEIMIEEQKQIAELFDMLKIEDSSTLHESICSLQEIVSGLKSNNEDKCVQSLISLEDALFKTENLESVNDEIVALLMSLVKYERNSKIQLHALRCISELTVKTEQEMQTLVRNNIVTVVSMALTSTHPRSRIQAVQVLGRIAASSAELQTCVFKRGVLPIIFSLIEKKSSVSDLLVITHCLYCFCHYNLEPISLIQIIKVIGNIFIEHNDLQLLIKIAYLFSTLSRSVEENIPLIYCTDIASTLVKYAMHPHEKLAWASLNILANSLKRSPSEAEEILNAGAFNVFKLCLNSHNPRILSDSCWALSIIAASAYRELLLDLILLQKIMQIARECVESIAVKALWVIKNLTEFEDSLTFLRNIGLVKVLNPLFRFTEKDALITVLILVKNTLGNYPSLSDIEKAELRGKLEELKLHSNSEVSNFARDLIEKY